MALGSMAIYFLIAQAIAIALSAIGVIATIVWNRIVARRRATMDALMAEQTNETLLKFRSEFVEASRTGTLHRAIEKDAWYTPQSFYFISTCNRYELVAIGIGEGTIDEGIYKRYWRTTLVTDWIKAKPAIATLRNRLNHNALYCDFEALARKWATLEEKTKV